MHGSFKVLFDWARPEARFWTEVAFGNAHVRPVEIRFVTGGGIILWIPALLYSGVFWAPAPCFRISSATRAAVEFFWLPSSFRLQPSMA
jgi:hypothetical protein